MSPFSVTDAHAASVPESTVMEQQLRQAQELSDPGEVSV
jgi:hypothetical protein